jgi:hypothetical protein
MHHHLLPLLSRFRFFHTYFWALLVSCLIVGVMATLARATLNLAGALQNKPDIGVLLLLPEEGITASSLIRAKDQTRDYLIMTKEGPKLARLKKGVEQWWVQEVIPLRE